MSDAHFQVWLDHDREPTCEEKTLLDQMMSVDFKGRDILVRQIETAKVNGYCDCGCKTITFHANTSVTPFPYPVRVPVEMVLYVDHINVPVFVLLHVIDGYISELEVIRADSAPIDGPIRPGQFEIIVEDTLVSSCAKDN